MNPPIRHSLTGIFLALGLWQCGDDKADQKGGGDSRTTSETAFLQASAEHQIPVRVLTASGFLESGLNPKVTGSLNLRGPGRGESAFGVSRKDLGLSDGAAGDRLSIQTEAYARWLSRKLGGGLKTTPETDEDKFNWIWALSEIHRSDESTRVLFAKELINLLNQGFEWVDPETFKIIRFEPESPPIDPENMRPVSREYLSLLNLYRTSPNLVNSAQYLTRKGQVSLDKFQNPRSILVKHCPFSLSACIEMQLWDGKTEKDFWLGAHYLIPQGPEISDFPLQLEPHTIAVPMTTENGETVFSQDQIIIVLTGASGRVSEGKRNPANPGWLTPWQLRRMGELVVDICNSLNIARSDLTREDCVRVGTGTRFDQQDDGPWHWGQIPDYDQIIFTSYIGSSQMLSGKTVFEHPGNQIFFKAGEPVTLNLTFGLRAQAVQLERMIRCPENGKVRWSVIAREQVHSISSFLFQKILLDPGPNLNGTQFFRAKVFDQNGLMGWDMATVYITEHNSSSPASFPGDCL